MSEATIWQQDIPGSNYHDICCQCPHHCGYCFENLANPRKRYCSDYCQGLAKRERALDRRLTTAAVTCTCPPDLMHQPYCERASERDMRDDDN